MYGIYYLMFATFPDLFSRVYGFSTGIGGLAYIGLGVGFFSATIFGAKVSNIIYTTVCLSARTAKLTMLTRMGTVGGQERWQGYTGDAHTLIDFRKFICSGGIIVSSLIAAFFHQSGSHMLLLAGTDGPLRPKFTGSCPSSDPASSGSA